METQKLTELVISAQKGDKIAMDTLVSESYQELYYYVLKTVKNEDLAYDVTQESFVEIITTIEKLREPAAFPLWARRIAYHKCALHFRQSKEIIIEENDDGETIFDQLPDVSEDTLPEAVVEDEEFRTTLLNMINSLPAEQTNALLLYYYERRSVGEIAEIQGVTQGTVKSRLNYARKAIKGKVEEHEAKTGTKLYSFTLLPLLLYFIFQGEKASIAPVEVSSAVTAATTAGAANTAAATASTVATETVAATAGSAIVGKIIAGVIAVAVVAGGIGFGFSKISKKTDKEDTSKPSATASGFEDSESTDSNPDNNSYKDTTTELDLSDFAGTWRKVQKTAEPETDYLVIDENGSLTWHRADQNQPIEYTIDKTSKKVKNGVVYSFSCQNNLLQKEYLRFKPMGAHYSLSIYGTSDKEYYYREEDLSYYDVIDLTPQNFDQYIEKAYSIDHRKDDKGEVYMIYAYSDLCFKEWAGPGSFLFGEFIYKRVEKNATYDPATRSFITGKVIDRNEEEITEEMQIIGAGDHHFYNYTYRDGHYYDYDYAQEMTFRKNNDGTYLIKTIYSYEFIEAKNIIGKVFVPKNMKLDEDFKLPDPPTEEVQLMDFDPVYNKLRDVSRSVNTLFFGFPSSQIPSNTSVTEFYKQEEAAAYINNLADLGYNYNNFDMTIDENGCYFTGFWGELSGQNRYFFLANPVYSAHRVMKVMKSVYDDQNDVLYVMFDYEQSIYEDTDRGVVIAWEDDIGCNSKAAYQFAALNLENFNENIEHIVFVTPEEKSICREDLNVSLLPYDAKYQKYEIFDFDMQATSFDFPSTKIPAENKVELITSKESFMAIQDEYNDILDREDDWVVFEPGYVKLKHGSNYDHLETTIKSDVPFLNLLISSPDLDPFSAVDVADIAFQVEGILGPENKFYSSFYDYETKTVYIYLEYTGKHTVFERFNDSIDQNSKSTYVLMSIGIDEFCEYPIENISIVLPDPATVPTE